MNLDAHPIHPDGSLVTRAAALAALGDPTRLRAVELLLVQDLTPAALGAALEVPGNLLAHHLRVLEQAGLVSRTPSQSDRRRTYVHLVDDALDGLLPTPAPLTANRVVFVCTHNSARSILAEALWRESSDIPTTSAGTHPADRINPRAKHVAESLGLSLGHELPQSVEGLLRPDDLVISVCDSVNEHLDPTDGPRLHWSIPDPAAVGSPAAFRAAADELNERITHLAPRVRRGRATTIRRTHR